MEAVAAPTSLQEAVIYFDNADRCLAEMVKMRWGAGPVACPTCGSVKVSFLKTRSLWECSEKHPKRQFSAKVGTIMEDSAISLSKWLVAMWLIANAKNGISSYELARSIKVGQKSAWFMLHRIRLAMQDDSTDKMSGEVEADETFVGGKVKNMHAARRQRFKGSRWAGKVAVMGLLERNGKNGTSRVRARVIRGTKRQDLVPVIEQNVAPGASVMTDALLSYATPGDTYVHQFIDHMESYARGTVHTNGLDNFWSLVKRAIRGTYVAVEPFHLFRYLDEQAFRFNLRKRRDAGRFAAVASAVAGKRLTFNELTAADSTFNRSAPARRRGPRKINSSQRTRAERG